MKILLPLLLSFLLTACSDHNTYEFWSCDQNKNEINVLKLPKTYKSTKDEDVRVIGKERNPYKGPPANARPSMPEEQQFFQTYFYPTYPDFVPLSIATSEQKKVMDDYNIATTIPTAELFRSGSVTYLLRAKNDEDIPLEKRTSQGHRKREETVDGKYWLWGDAWLRRGKGVSDGTAIFAPKGATTMTINCQSLLQGVRCIPQSALIRLGVV
jgi:hypothetical protein